MSLPSIPGFTSQERSVADFFDPPASDWPKELWPKAALSRLTPFPDGWLTVLESADGPDGERTGCSSVLIVPEQLEAALDSVSWDGSGLGNPGFWESAGERRFTDGLEEEEFRGVSARFFAHMRFHHGLQPPSFEVALPFLWFFDAIPKGEDWFTLDSDGREHGLVRVTRFDDDEYRVDVDAAQLRRYLAAADLVLLVQHDVHLVSQEPIKEDVFTEYRTDAAHFDWSAHDSRTWSTARTGSFSRLLGKIAVFPSQGDDDDGFHGGPFEEFIIDRDPLSGDLIRHTCDPNALRTNFDPPDDRPHQLTPVYFRLEVLGRYVSEPHRYHVTRTRLTCLDLWGVDAVRNSEDLLEVYLSDIGERIPRSERPHWLAFNVPPRGKMDEGRFRRDFLNQPAPTPNPVGNLLRSVQGVDDAFTARWGRPLRTALTDPLKTEFEHLYGPVTEDSSALMSPILTLTKGLIDSLDLKLLREITAVTDTSRKSLELLRELAAMQGGDADVIVGPLATLQRIRSKGQAHRSDTGRMKLLADEGLEGMSPLRQFDLICERVTDALNAMRDFVGASDES